MSQSNFDPNQDPYQQNPQPNQGQQPYPPGYNPQQPGQGYPQPGYGQPVYVIQQPTDVNNMAMLAHLSGIAGFLIPLIFWAVYKDKPGYEFTKESSRRAFNFNFSMWVINTAAFLLMVITFFILSPIWFLVVSVTGILMIIFHILGAIAANRGEMYNYPMTFIKILK